MWSRETWFEVEEATIDGIHSAMLSGALSCRSLVDTYLRRVSAFDRQGPKLGAIIRLCDQALERAAELDDELARTGRLSGPLHGIPLLVKDCIETADAPTTFGSISTGEYRPNQDAEVVRRLRAAGAVILAKTTLCDFAAGWTSYSSRSRETKNPYALERDSGGSSAGSAAGVAANFATAAIGTDCGGSIRVPASFCNLVGLRPTAGVVPHAGVLPLISGQDTVGPLARSVADAATLLSVLTQEEPPAQAAAVEHGSDSTNGMKTLQWAHIGVLEHGFGEHHPEMKAVSSVVMRALDDAATAGASLVEIRIPDLQARLEATSMYLLRSRRDIDAFLAARPSLPLRSLDEIHARGRYDHRLDLIDAIVAAGNAPGTDAEHARRTAAREALTAMLEGLMNHHHLDAFAYPSVQVLAPLRDEPPEWTTLTFPTNTLIASQAWLPAITVPAGFTPGGFPVGLELLARQHDDSRLLHLATAVERLTRQRRSPASTPNLTTARTHDPPTANPTTG